jgi:hypothetical protein
MVRLKFRPQEWNTGGRKKIYKSSEEEGWEISQIKMGGSKAEEAGKEPVDIWKGAAETGRGEGEVGQAVRRQEVELERQKRSSQVERYRKKQYSQGLDELQRQNEQ